LTVKEKIILNLYNFVKYIGSDDFKAWGITSHNVVVESAPMTEDCVGKSKIEQCEFIRHNS
jgi:KUP system potassium uptake protein